MVALGFKLGLLGFWALWLSVIALTNLCDGLKALGVLSPDWRFASRNFARVERAVAVYGRNRRLAGVLFTAVVAWQVLAAALFWRAAAVSWSAQAMVRPAVDLAFAVVLALWAAFMLAEEIFKQYQAETSHVLFFTMQLVSWVAVYGL